METANITYQDETSGDIKSIIDYSKCIVCGRCLTACKHDARYFTDDTQRFFEDLQSGKPISLIAAPSVKTNIPEYKKLFTYLKRKGVNRIYDVSLGADICVWAHTRYMENNRQPLITQPCPAIVTYCEMYRHDLLPRLSPVHSPMACTVIYMQQNKGIHDKIAALSPCLAKSLEFESTNLAEYNVTYAKLFEYLKNIELPEEETDFDHEASGSGTLLPMPGSLKDNIEYFTERKIHTVKSEGKGVYDLLTQYAEMPEELLPEVFDVLSCKNGCNIGTAAKAGCFFTINQQMNQQRQNVTGKDKKEKYKALYKYFNESLDVSSYLRTYKAIPTVFPLISEGDIHDAFVSMGKTTQETKTVDCSACGSGTCYEMARKIALRVNIPANCIIKSKDDARAEHAENLLVQAQLTQMEQIKQITETNAREQELQLAKIDTIIKVSHIGMWDMYTNMENLLKPDNPINYSDEFRYILGYENEEDFPNILDSWSKRLHPDDFDKTVDVLTRHLTDKTGIIPFDAEYRILKKNNEWAYARAMGTTLRDSIGNPVRFLGAFVDMTRMKNLIEAAEAANKAKSTFLSQISHEIRTPINAVLGTAEIQLQKDSNTPDIEESFNRIYNSGNLLLKIINDLLDLSKIEAGKLTLMPVEYSLPGLIYDTVQINLLRYESKPIEFNLIIHEDTPHDMCGDELRIKQIINNILSNAFKYTDSGEIELAVSVESPSEKSCVLVLQISDTGQGLTREQIAKIFDEYTRFNGNDNHTTVGTGLGMTITKRFLDMMDGEVKIVSEPGVGSVFTVKIPQKRVGTILCGPDMANKLRSSRYQSMLKMRKEKIAHDYMPYGSVLIVDDVESNLYVAKGLLMPYGLKIDTVSNGFDVIKRIEEGNIYDIIFMDHMMPILDGIETTKRLREAAYFHPIVALTANATIGQEEMFLQNGFDGFISKPIDMRELNAALNKWVRDIQPLETIMEARSKIGNHKPQNKNNLIKLVISDIENTLAVLTDLMPKINNENPDDLKLYATNVHGMKSALTHIGETDLADDAFTLEKAAEKEDLQTILDKTPPFMDALEKIVETHKTTTATTEDLTEDNKQLLQEKLTEIKTACEKIKKNAARTALDELNKILWPRHITELLDEISIHLLHGQFKKAITAIEKGVL
jgi:signal transduction histidine kinase/CheY-like chemotaxis protein/ferredoxin